MAVEMDDAQSGQARLQRRDTLVKRVAQGIAIGIEQQYLGAGAGVGRGFQRA